MTLVEDLVKNRDVYVEAPAGCGKTQLIVDTISNFGSGKQLVLTHTHAGVHALRKRFQDSKASSDKFHVDTIAGFCLRYACAFPYLSGFKKGFPESQEDWSQLYFASEALFASNAIIKILRASYGGVFVDEYQDCSTLQHRLILSIGQTLPLRVFGDPLQSIFDFAEDGVVDWERDVVATFALAGKLIEPHRWNKNGSKELGHWLLSEVRPALLEGRLPNYASAPRHSVEVVKLPAALNPKDRWKITRVQQDVCRYFKGGKEQTVVAIHSGSNVNPCFSLAKSLSGRFSPIETIECPLLMEWADKIQNSELDNQPFLLYSFAKKCLSSRPCINRNINNTSVLR